MTTVMTFIIMSMDRIDLQYTQPLVGVIYAKTMFRKRGYFGQQISLLGGRVDTGERKAKVENNVATGGVFCIYYVKYGWKKCLQTLFNLCSPLV